MSLRQKFVHLIFRLRSYNNMQLKNFSSNVHNTKILELGSGRSIKGVYVYSAKQFFDTTNEFIQSDIVPEFGHDLIDVTVMDYFEEFDIILCMNVLEHVFDFHEAIENIFRALKGNGIALFFTPGFYPLHDEPNDYWRFTEHSLRAILNEFKSVKIEYRGIRKYPFAYFIKAVK